MRCFEIVLLTTLLLSAAHGYTGNHGPNKRSFGEDVDVSAYPMRLTRDVQRQDYFSSPPDEQEMVLKGVEDGGPAPATGGGWGFTMGAVKGMLNKDAVTGLIQNAKNFAPENLQAFIPSEAVIKNYLPDVETMAAKTSGSEKPISPMQSMTQKFFGATGLSTELTEKLVSAMSDQILKKKNGNLNDIMNGMGQAVAQKAVENAAPLLIRLVIHKVLNGLAANTLGTKFASMASTKITLVSDAIADKAIVQFVNYNGPFKDDLLNFLSKLNYADVLKNVLALQQKLNA